MSFHRLYPPPEFVIITWYLPFDSSCTSGTGVSGVPKERTGISVTPGAVRTLESSAAIVKDAVAFGTRS